METMTLTSVPGIKVGHWTDEAALTGCTVVLCESGAVAGVDVRGGGPGTRETDLLAPGRMVERVDAIVLTGGSAFGLAAADGVMRYVEEQGKGFDTGIARVPIVPAAVIFDLGIGDGSVRPGSGQGYAAAASASAQPVPEGNVGAGAGATAGKWAGPNFAMKSGLGTSAIRLPDGGTVGALVAANPVGDIIDPLTGSIVSGAYDRGGETFVARAVAGGSRGDGGADTPGGQGSLPPNTVIAVVATDVPVSKEGMHRVAMMAHDGIARTVYPAHTPFDGDTVFALSTGKAPVEPVDSRAAEMERVGQIGAAAAEALAQAIVRAAKAAVGAGGVISYAEVGRP